MKRLTTRSPEETQKFGEKLAKKLKAGAVVALFGELGSGKTCLIQGICRGLGVKNSVTSPAFLIINEYKGNLPVYHFDLYRITTVNELYQLGYEEYFYSGGICLIEWAQKAENLLPEDSIKIYMFRRGQNIREIKTRGNYV